MDPRKQRIAIAKVLGWRQERSKHDTLRIVSPDGTELWQYDLRGNSYGPTKDWMGAVKDNDIPDYPHDLNAMHDAERVLRCSEKYIQFHAWNNYCEHLGFFLRPQNVHDNNCVHATAAQRAKAFLKTIGKWETD